MSGRRTSKRTVIVELRALVLIVVSLEVGGLLGLLTLAATGGIWAAAVAGASGFGATLVGLNELVGG